MHSCGEYFFERKANLIFFTFNIYDAFNGFAFMISTYHIPTCKNSACTFVYTVLIEYVGTQ